MRLGIGSYAYGWAVGVAGYPPSQPMDEIALLEMAHSLGVGVVQIADNLPLHTFDAARLERLTRRATALGIALEAGARRLTSERIAAYATRAWQIGSPFVRWVIDDADYHPDVETIVGILRESLPDLGDVALAIENHDRFTARTLREIIEAVDDPRVGICLDTANSLGAGEGVMAVAECLAPYVLNLHLKDVTAARLPHMMGFHVEGSPAGSGLVPIPRLLELLAPHGRCHTAILEQWTPPEPRLEDTLAKESDWAAQSLAYLCSLPGLTG